MPGQIGISAIAWACSATCNLTPSASIDLPGREIRVGDVVDLACVTGHDRATIAGLVIAEIPAAATTTELSRAALKSLARRRVPGLFFTPDPDDAQLVTLHGPAEKQKSGEAPTCARTRAPISAGAIITSALVEPVPCDADEPTGPQVYYDRLHGVPRAIANLPAGAGLGRIAVPAGAYDAGETLRLAITTGAVRIEREVEAVQPAIAGKDIFLRDANGVVFASPTRSEPQEAPHE